MKKFVMLHLGFVQPSLKVMAEWAAWFQSIKKHTVQNVGFCGGKEISAAGEADLTLTPDAVTGMTVVRARDLDHAMELAAGAPFVKSLRIYEVMEY